MAKNRKNIIIRIQDWIESVPGQTFLNYAYSWGAGRGYSWSFVQTDSYPRG